jgi:signal transduction histidine kinase
MEDAMMTSIRWRLVASFALLTLLTAAAIGVLAMSLIHRYVERQEQEYLQANAGAIALQSVIFMHPMPVYRALCNLLDNALKFTPSGGVVQTGALAAEDGVYFWVADTGIGIEAAELPHIFGRFHRCASTQRPGSGLGLAIVQSIVQAHGGRVEATSMVGKAAAFRSGCPRDGFHDFIAADFPHSHASNHDLQLPQKGYQVRLLFRR